MVVSPTSQPSSSPRPLANGACSKPVKFKPVSQFYGEEAPEEEEEESDPRTDEDDPDEWSDWEDSSRPVKKRKMSSMNNEFHDPARETPVFRTLAQLLEPRRIERIKSYPPKRKKSSVARDVATKLRKFYCKPRTSRTNGRTLEGNIGLIVDLVFQSIEEGSSSNCPSKDDLLRSLPAEDSMDICNDTGRGKVAEKEESTNQEVSMTASNTVEDEQKIVEDEQKIITVKDPTSLTIARLFALEKAKDASWNPSFQTPMKWREIDVGGADPFKLVNRKCKVYNPLERKWFAAFISQYDEQRMKHQVKYDVHGDTWQCLLRERIVFYISLEEKMSLIAGENCYAEERKMKVDELLVLSASIESYDRFFQHGVIVWAETPGYPMWPAFVMDEQHARLRNLEVSAGKVPVHYFGTHESVRVNSRRIVKFSEGLVQDYHMKCNRISFDKSLEQIDRYYKEQKLPPAMAYLQEEVAVKLDKDSNSGDQCEHDEDFVGDERKHKVRKSLESISKCPIKLGSLQVLSLGKIVKDSEYFHDHHYIWTEGYTSIRNFFSIKDPTKMVCYKMEILRNPNARTMPLFRVTPEDGEQVEGPSAAACWKRILDRLHRARKRLFPGLHGKSDTKRQFYRSGAAMFGLSHPQISRLIQALPYARVCSKFKVWAEGTSFEDLDGLLPAGFKHVEAKWKHLDHCSVCDTNEEYEGNILLQCDKCRMLVHLNCYGVPEPPGDSWLCNLCDSNAPRKCPPCCLCPIKGGAMKRTTDGRWVHLACALWIPETSCVDMERMEPIEGINSINKERWKLTCTLCKVPYGACIQCAVHHCRVSYHPLCARAAGFCTKVLEGLRRKRNRITGIQEEERSVQLLSYCKKHMHNKISTKTTFDLFSSEENDCGYSLNNPSGSARSEPYNVAIRRGRREPDRYSAAVAKRAFLVNGPYIVTGCQRNPFKRIKCLPPVPVGGSKVQPFLIIGPKSSDGSQVALTVSQRFSQMRASLHRRLTFGKSAIHGWGLFAKEPHGAGDMVIEYAGEIIRPVVADVREKSCYNSLVGAGTYMFCIDNERVVDATRAGSIAHLINHSCEPNCYSRVVTTRGKERIVIFAKQDIAGGEEVTYDYRFTSIGDQLPCHCGSGACRGIVNVMDEEDDSGRILVRASELNKWR